MIEQIDFHQPRQLIDIFKDSGHFLRQNAAILFRQLSLLFALIYLVRYRHLANTVQFSDAAPGIIFINALPIYLIYGMLFCLYLLLVSVFIRLYIELGYEQFDFWDVLVAAVRKLPTFAGLMLTNALLALTAAVFFLLPLIYILPVIGMSVAAIGVSDQSILTALAESYTVVSRRWWHSFGVGLALLVPVGAIAVIGSAVLPAAAPLLQAAVETVWLMFTGFAGIFSLAGWQMYYLSCITEDLPVSIK